MPNFRFGQIANAVSGSLDLMIGREAEKERRNIEQQWQLALEDLRARREGEREDRAIARETGREERAIAREKTASEAATQRHAATTSATAQYRSDTLAQGESQFNKQQVASAEESLFKRIDDARERAAKEAEGIFEDPEAAGRIATRTNQIIEEMIIGHVVRLGSGNAPGYEINDPGAMQSKFIALGMGPEGAATRTTELGPSLWPDLIPAGQEPIKTDGIINATGQSVSEVNLPIGVKAGGAAEAAPGSSAAATKPVMQSQQPPAPGSLRGIMQSKTIMNPDGTPKYPAKEDAPLNRFGRWLMGPSDELFGPGGN